MDFKNLVIIGERINPGFRSSKKLFDESDIDGIRKLAASQAEKGAKYLNVNIGDRAMKDQAFYREVIRAIQSTVSLPLSFDFPNREVQEICLETYDPARANGARPIMNSISELRWDMLELYKKFRFKVILMVSERMEDGERISNKTPDEVYMTARRMIRYILETADNISINDIFIDVSVCPVAGDMEGLIRMAVESIKKIGSDRELKGVHMSVGLSNISIMVPPQALNNSPLKLYLESAFLTNTVPFGLDTIIGTPGREYKNLPENDFVLQGFNEALKLDGIEAVMRIQKLYME
ncbi:MAG TPA: dihydropteroate synthase DHPS [Spirochaetia bacterium]|nr:dihydropteroate synthase DHPS [Spirochaetia bacterium]